MFWLVMLFFKKCCSSTNQNRGFPDIRMEGEMMSSRQTSGEDFPLSTHSMKARVRVSGHLLGGCSVLSTWGDTAAFTGLPP